MNSKLFMVLCLMITTCLCFGQSHYLIKSFDAYKDKNRIILNWSIKKGNSCVGIGILRSENDINYTKIGEIHGICGDNESETNYTFVDESPNHANYYVLELGASGITDPPLFVKFISLDGKASKVIPNPAIYTAYVLFDNPNNEKHTVRFYSNDGKLIRQNITNEDKVYISLENLDDRLLGGPFQKTYYYTIHDAQNSKISDGIFMFNN